MKSWIKGKKYEYFLVISSPWKWIDKWLRYIAKLCDIYDVYNQIIVIYDIVSSDVRCCGLKDKASLLGLSELVTTGLGPRPIESPTTK